VLIEISPDVIQKFKVKGQFKKKRFLGKELNDHLQQFTVTKEMKEKAKLDLTPFIQDLVTHTLKGGEYPSSDQMADYLISTIDFYKEDKVIYYLLLVVINLHFTDIFFFKKKTLGYN